jgi:L-galactose dehydrogenase
MDYRQLGKTDLNVSLLGFGASPLGDAFRTTDPAEAISAVHMAIDSGINFFDVAPYYGLTLAEERLGKALAGRRDKVILATKCGRYGLGGFDFSAARVTASIDESLMRLQTDYVDLLQVHDVEFGDFTQIVEETLPTLRQIQKLGKARYIGVTGYPLGMLSRIIEAVPVDTVLTYCRYNLMITDMDEMLTPIAKKHGVGLINASGLNMGILTERGAPDWHPAPVEVRDAGKQAVRLCNKRGIDTAHVALRFCFDHPYVSSTLVGMSTRHHVETNLDALQAASDHPLREELRHILKPVFNYVWPSGKPENFDPQTFLS